MVIAVGFNDERRADTLARAVAANGFVVRNVYADKAYMSEENLQAVLDLGGDPCIPFKSNSRPRQPAMKQLYHRFALARDEFEAKYRDHPIIECGFSMFKRKFSESVRARGFTAQTNEALFLVLAHNLDVLAHAAIEFGADLGPILGPNSTLRIS